MLTERDSRSILAITRSIADCSCGVFEHLGERLSGNPPHHPVPKSSYPGRAGIAGDHTEVSDRVTGGHFTKHLSVGTHGCESSRVDYIDGIRRVA